MIIELHKSSVYVCLRLLLSRYILILLIVDSTLTPQPVNQFSGFTQAGIDWVREHVCPSSLTQKTAEVMVDE